MLHRHSSRSRRTTRYATWLSALKRWHLQNLPSHQRMKKWRLRSLVEMGMIVPQSAKLRHLDAVQDRTFGSTLRRSRTEIRCNATAAGYTSKGPLLLAIYGGNSVTLSNLNRFLVIWEIKGCSCFKLWYNTRIVCVSNNGAILPYKISQNKPQLN